MRGVLNVNKPAGITSYDVIRRLKPLIGTTRIGHAGTLDPLARGVLLILLGAATKIADLLQSQVKEYLAEVRLGVRTDTDDSAGRIIEEKPVPAMAREQLVTMLGEFKGEHEQVPPAYSALKLGGVPAYARARNGEMPQLKARHVVVRDIALEKVATKAFSFRAVVSKGTYIRALARDMGEKLGCGAVLQALTRTRIGRFRIDDAVELDAITGENLAGHTITINDALEFLPLLHVKPGAVERLRNGQVLHASEVEEATFEQEGDRVRLTVPGDLVLVISEIRAGRLKPIRGIYDDTLVG